MSTTLPFRRRKLTAFDRNCLKQGKALFRTENGHIRCGSRERLTRSESRRAKSLLENATVKKLKSFAKLKGFSGYSGMSRSKLIHLIYNYTDPVSGDIVYRTSARQGEYPGRKYFTKSRSKSRSKSHSKRLKRSKSHKRRSKY